MNTLQRIIHSCIVGLSLTLSAGVVAHDTHIERVYATFTSPVRPRPYTESDQQVPQRPIEEMRAGQHTHVTDNPLSHTLANSFAYQSPSIAPRRDSHHKQLLRTLEMGGRHAFDDAFLPVIS